MEMLGELLETHDIEFDAVERRIRCVARQSLVDGDCNLMFLKGASHM